MPATKDYTRRERTEISVSLTTRLEDKDNPAKYIYTPTFSEVFKDEHLAYIKAYDVLFYVYLEPERYDEIAKCWVGKPLLRLEHVGLYCDLYFAAERGERFNHDDYAERRDLSPHTLRTMLDRLEDARLIIRLKDRSGRGHATHIIVCTPYTRDEMVRMRPILAARIAEHVTRTEREGANVKRGQRRWPLVSWDTQTIRRAIKVPDLARDIVGLQKIVLRVREEQAKTGQLLDDNGLTVEVKRRSKIDGVGFSRKLFSTALAMLHVSEFARFSAEPAELP